MTVIEEENRHGWIVAGSPPWFIRSDPSTGTLSVTGAVMLGITVDSQASVAQIVGRDTELGRLEQTLDALDQGAAVCLTVEGEPGIGKTRLLGALKSSAEQRGHIVLSGAAAEFERELPFSVFVDALDAYVTSQQLSEHEGGAARAAEESIAAATAIGAKLQVACSRSLPGKALVAAGERRQAIEVVRAAERELDECGSERMRDEARRELRKLGARAEVRGPAASGDSGLDALSAREREISDLITERMTNKQIAAALVLSEKTIETHIRNIFHTLGASSRVEVARIVERDGRPAGQ